MKRSKTIKLTLMASTALALSACGEEERETAEAFRTLDDCVASNLFTEEQCQTSLDEAKSVHEQSAPRYNSESLCVQEFGPSNCYRHGGGSAHGSSGSFWLPFMTGYMVSNLVDSAFGRHYSTPYYYHSSGSLRTWDGRSIQTRRDANGRIKPTISRKTVYAKPKPAKVMTRTSVISRGGFGSRSKSSRGRYSRGG